MSDPVLLPQPRRTEWSGATVDVGGLQVTIDPTLPPQGYRLTVADHGGVRLVAADDAGAFYGRATLDQLVAQGRVPVGVVEDAPDLAVRGVMLDVSRDKVPTIETLEALLDRLASWKINHVELYMEHTFAYTGHDEVWATASPFTPDEIRRLDRFCRDRFIQLTPNQNCLGHFERWLRHDRYRPLAISPGGWTDARGRRRPPTTLEPTHPDVLPLIDSLLRELASSFSSGEQVHVGLDEPWELPDERFDDYLDYVRRLRATPALDGREMLMWGDIVASHPERLGELPDGVTVCEWGYEDGHPFAERAELLASAGRPFWLCPGTSSWNTLVGRTTNMVGNIRGAAVAAVDAGADGLFVTDWGDNGHLQPLAVSEPGFALGRGAVVVRLLERRPRPRSRAVAPRLRRRDRCLGVRTARARRRPPPRGAAGAQQLDPPAPPVLPALPDGRGLHGRTHRRRPGRGRGRHRRRARRPGPQPTVAGRR